MKKSILVLLLGFSVQASAVQMCDVQVCNKLERFTIDPWSMVKDAAGEQCYSLVLPKSDAVAGRILNSETRWYQGRSINPTKKSVTRIKSIGKCWEEQ